MANVRLSKKPLKRVFIKHIPQAVPVNVSTPVKNIPVTETKDMAIETVVETPIVEEVKPVKKTRKSKKNAVQGEQKDE